MRGLDGGFVLLVRHVVILGRREKSDKSDRSDRSDEGEGLFQTVFGVRSAFPESNFLRCLSFCMEILIKEQIVCS